MKNSINQIFKPVINTIKRFNLIIFIVAVVGGLILAIITLTDALQRSADGTNSSNNNAVFDQATVTRLEKLKTSSETAGAPTLPPGRVSPFTE